MLITPHIKSTHTHNPKPQNQERKENTKDKNNSIKSTPTSDAKTVTLANKTYNNSNETNKESSTNRWIVFLTGVLTIAGGIQAGIYIWQACLIRQTMRISQRAWVTVSFTPYAPTGQNEAT